MSVRLKKGDITIEEILTLSKFSYKGDVDDKLIREKLDVVGGKIVARKGLTYDKVNKVWGQTSREVRFDFIIRSKPVSYKKTDNVPTHRYPVTFLLKDFNLGMKSPFRWRTGGLKKWKNSEKAKRNISEGKNEKEKDIIRKEKEQLKIKNQKIQDQNIRNGLQGNFIFTLMWVLNQYELLFGPLTCKNLPPKITNPEYIPFFDKTALYVVLKVLPKILSNPKLGQAFGK